MTATVDKQRVRQLQRLPKRELITRCETAGILGPDLHKWSNFDLATEAARAEQGATA